VRPSTAELLVPLDLERAGNEVRKAWFRCLLDWNWRDTFKPFEILKASGSRTILRTSFYDVLRKPGVVAQFLWNRVTVESSNKRWTVLSSGYCSFGRIDFATLLDSADEAEIEGLTEYFNDPANTTEKTGNNVVPSILATVWTRVAGKVVIPYDVDQRRRLFRDAYKALHPMIEYYETLKHTQGQ